MNDEMLQPESRSRRRLYITIAIAVGFLFLYPAFICGCHFHVEAALVNAVPFCWGFFALVTYRDTEEQIVGWLAFGLAMLSVWMGFESNLIFAFK